MSKIRLRYVKIFTLLIVGLVVMISYGKQGNSDKVDNIFKLATDGSPSDLDLALRELDKDSISKLRIGRNHTLAHVGINNRKHPEVLRLISEAGVDLDIQDDDGRTALHHAIDNNHADAARILIGLGANLHIDNDAGYSPIRFCQEALASLPDHETCLVVLREAGRDTK